MKVWAGAAVALVAVALAQTAVAAIRTTTPSKRVTIVVRINDRGISPLAQFNWQGSGEIMKVMPVGDKVTRGDYATFTVFNSGKRPHNFTILGRKTPILKPG